MLRVSQDAATQQAAWCLSLWSWTLAAAGYQSDRVALNCGDVCKMRDPFFLSFFLEMFI